MSKHELCGFNLLNHRNESQIHKNFRVMLKSTMLHTICTNCTCTCILHVCGILSTLTRNIRLYPYLDSIAEKSTPSSAPDGASEMNVKISSIRLTHKICNIQQVFNQLKINMYIMYRFIVTT